MVMRWLALISIVALVGCPTLPTPTHNLFFDEAPPERLLAKLGPPRAWVAQSRLARLNDAQFFERAFEPTSGVVTIFNLFEDLRFTVTAKDYSSVGSGTVIWHGVDSAGATLRIALAIVGRTIDGEIRTSSGTVRITPVEDGWHRIERYASTNFPQEGDPIEVSSTAGDVDVLSICDEADSGRPNPGPGKGTPIRLLLAYTPAAANAVGNVNVFTDQIVDQLTQIWGSSPFFNVFPKLAHVAQVTYMESGSSQTDLRRLQDARDGHMDEIHSLRDAHKADLVALITVTQDVCGIGYKPYPPSRTNAGAGFTVTASDCALGNMSLAHELGHNFSLDHDRFVAGSIPGRYNYGYSNVNLRVRTIMAYANECNHRGVYCERLPTYSYPYPYSKDERIGRPIGSSNAAHNRNMFCLGAGAVSQYR